MINEVIEEEGSSSIEMLEKLIEITKANQEELISDPESVNLILDFFCLLCLGDFFFYHVLQISTCNCKGAQKVLFATSSKKS